MHPPPTPACPLRTWLTRLVCCLLLQGLIPADAQSVPPVSLTQVPAEGVRLSNGWRFQAGNIPNGASPQLDDHYWPAINPTLDIRQLPQLQQSGIGWLRLHLTTGPDLPPLMLYIFQSVASEIYLDGRLLYRFGRVSSHPDQVLAYSPAAAYNLPLRPAAHHLLAVRFACQPGLDFNKKYLHWSAPALEFRLYPAAVLPAIRPITLQGAYSDAFKVGIAFILLILHLSLILAYPAQRANRYAAGMYLLLSVTFLARAIDGLGHPTSLRSLLYYGSLLDVAVPAVALLTFYSLFNFRKGWLCWLAIGSIGFQFLPLPTGYQWLSVVVSYYMQFELVRLAIVAGRRRLLGARIVLMGVLVNLGLWVTSSAIGLLHVPYDGHEWLYNMLFVLSFLCFPLTLSLRLALEHGWVNRQLRVQLQEVESLSARNLVQQQERQQLLADQNAELERQVAGRTQELTQQTEQLRELDEVKSRFVANVTHEFRTPLSLIMAPVEKLIQEKRFDGPTLRLVHRNADQLLRLINQLLDLSKLENNFMAVSLTQGSPAEFIGQTVDGFRPSAGQKAITLTYAAADMPDHEQVFDADKWEKILTNLLANALKFTPSGGHVTLTATPVWAATRLTGVEFELVDSGIGIVARKLPHIFDRFYQADNSMTRTYTGTGIGLALVHELIGLLGGTISVASESGVGTTFRLTLPVQPVPTLAETPVVRWSAAELPLVAHETPNSSVSAGTPPAADHPVPRILIVEDNDELREFLVGELTQAYQIFQAADGEAGWKTAQTELPDVVLTDVMMPRMDGHELTRLLKTHPDTDHIAVVMLTAKTAQQSRIDGLQQGADDYLAKPFSIDELHLRLHNLITRQQKLGDHYRQQFAYPGTPTADVPGYTPAAFPAPDPVRPDPFLQRIYNLLDQHLDDPSISVEWLADELAMSRKTLYRKVHSLIQLPPADLIRQYRLRRAAELLYAGRNVTETADLVGFGSPSHFSIAFKEFYRKTPTAFMASRAGNA